MRSKLSELVELKMQVGFLVGQLRHYEVLIIGAGEGIGKLLSSIDGVLGQLEKSPKMDRAVKDPVLLAFLLHLKQEREKLTQQEIQLGEVAKDPPNLQGRLPRAPLAPTPEQAREAGLDQDEERPGAGDPPKTE